MSIEDRKTARRFGDPVGNVDTHADLKSLVNIYLGMTECVKAKLDKAARFHEQAKELNAGADHVLARVAEAIPKGQVRQVVMLPDGRAALVEWQCGSVQVEQIVVE